MSDVIQIPSRGIRCPVTPKQIHTARKPTTEQVWAMCGYMNDPLEKCKGCPEWEERDGEKFQRMCFGLAQEACKAVFALEQETGE